jgi:hypothetical protein
METAVPMSIMPDYFEKLEARIWQELREGIAAWGESVTALSHWEEEHLLDSPAAETLAAHAQAVRRLIRFGRFITLATEHRDFPDPGLKGNVAATLQTLEDKIPLWHGTMPKDKSEALLRAAFPE